MESFPVAEKSVQQLQQVLAAAHIYLRSGETFAPAAFGAVGQIGERASRYPQLVEMGQQGPPEFR
jgi:hypothetical protein